MSPYAGGPAAEWYVAHRVTENETGGVYLIIRGYDTFPLPTDHARRLAQALLDAADRSDEAAGTLTATVDYQPEGETDAS